MTANATGSGLDEASLSRIPKILQAAVDEGAVSGFVTLVWQGGQEVQLNAIGRRNLSTGAPMTRDTLFRIASMTKPVTSLAALMLMEEGKLRLDDRISRWLPEFAEMRLLAEPTGPLDRTMPAPREITVEDLLTHRAGLAYGFSAPGPLGKAYEASLGSPVYSTLPPDEWLRRLAALPLAYPPGQKMHYSHATDVLGFLIARVEGRPLGEVLRAKIFAPLGMDDTAFWLPPQTRDRLARLYSRPAEGGPLKDVSLPMDDPASPNESGGGGLISSVDDYLKFARLLLNRGELDGVRLVRPETVDLMTANHLTPAQREHTFLGLPYWESMGFGLGVSVVMDAQKHQAMGAGGEGAFGWPGAFGTWWLADPANDLILIYLVQDSLPLSAEVLTGSRPKVPSRTAQVDFERIAYAALEAGRLQDA